MLDKYISKNFYFLYLSLLCLRDKYYILLLLMGGLAWFLPKAQAKIPWSDLALAAFIEEVAFRAFLQEGLKKLDYFNKSKLGLSRSNLTVSFFFAMLHLYSHPPAWALSVFFPSLAFGWSWDKYKNLFPCWLLHFSYNFLYFYRI